LPTHPEPSPKTYGRDEVVAVRSKIRNDIAQLAVEHEDLQLVIDEYEEVVHHEADPLADIGAIFQACHDVIVDLKHLLNPTGLPLHLSNDGRVVAHNFEGVTTFLTDIRGFTELSNHVCESWKISIFDVLSFCYFPHVTEVLERYGCHYLNYTGDGLLVLCRDRKDENDHVILPSIDNAVICSIALTGVTRAIADSWKAMGMCKADGHSHETGLGLSFGDVQVGDPFVPYRENDSKCAEFDRIFRERLPQVAKDFVPRESYSHRVRAIQALSTSINRASRLQDADKEAPNHTVMMTEEDVNRLSPPLRRYFERVAKITLRGLGTAEVYGIHRYDLYDVHAIERECLDYHANVKKSS
jgi:class 3 adenylate cyclase